MSACMEAKASIAEICWKESMVAVEDGNLYHLHHRAWEAVKVKRGSGKREFLFMPLGCLEDGRRVIYLRGVSLPDNISRWTPGVAYGDSREMRLFYRPVHRPSSGSERLMNPEDALSKLTTQLMGFDLQGVTMVNRRAQFRGRIQLPYYDCKGRLIVTDPAAANAAMLAGVGRGKGFGFGMMILL